MTDILLIVGGYLFGSISTAIVVCRLMGLPDPRGVGSGNPGATNVLRLGGKKAAAVTLFGDMLKGFVPALAAVLTGQRPEVIALVALAAFLGHLYPIFFRFEGGKGVATALGVLFGLSWMVGGATAATWLVTAAITRISSLSALVAMAIAPGYVWWVFQSMALTVAMGVMTVLLYWRHRENIRRILSGEEKKIGR